MVLELNTTLLYRIWCALKSLSQSKVEFVIIWPLCKCWYGNRTEFITYKNPEVGIKVLNLCKIAKKILDVKIELSIQLDCFSSCLGHVVFVLWKELE